MSRMFYSLDNVIDNSDVLKASSFFFNNPNLHGTTYGDNKIIYFHWDVNSNIFPECFRRVRRKIIELHSLQDHFSCKGTDDFLICIEEGHELPKHVDIIKNVLESDYQHTRANWILSTSENGGFIYAEEQKYIPKVNNILLLDAKKNHGVTTVKGKTPLMIYSFGFIKRCVTHVL